MILDINGDELEDIYGLITARIYYLDSAIRNYKEQLKTDIDVYTRRDIETSLAFLRGEQNLLRKLARKIQKQVKEGVNVT